MTTKKRLLDFLTYLSIGQTVFEKKVGISNGYVNNVKNSIGSEIISKISDVYPELSTEWLLTGKGEMLRNNQQIGDIAHSTVVGANVNGNGNRITNNDVTSMIELQKGYQEMIKKSQEQIDRLIGIIENTK